MVTNDQGMYMTKACPYIIAKALRVEILIIALPSWLSAIMIVLKIRLSGFFVVRIMW